jgi:glycogen debranching enzyme
MDAYKIAVNDLRACYGPNGIFAGLHHFNDYWARDALFAALGSLKLKDYTIVKENLELFIANIKKDGQVPLRIGRNIIGIFLNKKKRLPIYKFDFSRKSALDQNSLLIIAAYEYYIKTKDREFLKKNIKKLESIIRWNFLNDEDNDLLLEECGFSTWADSINKKGKVLYTNVCHCHALFCMYKLSKNKKYLFLYEKVKKRINELFWSGEYYLDWIDDEKHYNYFSTDGNILAVIWEIADKEKAKHIEESSHIFEIHDIPSECVHPNYPKKFISLPLKIIGLSDYHNGLSWLWLGCISAVAKHKVGRKKDAAQLMKKIEEIIIKHGSVYEVYNKKGNPVRRLLYRSEHPFAWSAGMFIYAYHEIIRNKN